MKRTGVSIVAVAIVAVLAAPAQAAAPYQPDAMINPAMVGWVGQDIIGTSGADQAAWLGVSSGGVVDFEIAVQNDGIFADSFTFLGCGSKRGYKVRYILAGENVTGQVRSGTLSSIVFSPGGVGGGLHVRIKATADARIKMVCDIVVSSANSGSNDTVRAAVAILA